MTSSALAISSRDPSPTESATGAAGPAPPAPPGRPGETDGTSRDQRSVELLSRAARTGSEARRAELIRQVVVANMPLALSVAARFRFRGVAAEDLDQVAYLALVKAARGYDPTAGSSFASYCLPTVRGEVKRYFRDQGWTVRPPRRIQEVQAATFRAEGELAARLGRSPRPTEVAAHLGLPLDDVNEALATHGCFTPTSLDLPVGDEGGGSLGDLLGTEDDGRDAAEARVMLAPAVRRLSDRDRHILSLRFFRGWTQLEIGRDLGVTQMQVSRLLSRILRDLRGDLDGELRSDLGSDLGRPACAASPHPADLAVAPGSG